MGQELSHVKRVSGSVNGSIQAFFLSDREIRRRARALNKMFHAHQQSLDNTLFQVHPPCPIPFPRVAVRISVTKQVGEGTAVELRKLTIRQFSLLFLHLQDRLRTSAPADADLWHGPSREAGGEQRREAGEGSGEGEGAQNAQGEGEHAEREEGGEGSEAGEGGGRDRSREESEGEGECSICLDGRVNNALPCGHAFCEDCIAQWTAISSACPLCRQQASGEAWTMFGYPTAAEMCGAMESLILSV